MKKRCYIILGTIAALVLLSALVTSYIDSARVRNSVEPKYTIKIVSADGNKVTYWGLGYKVIRYPSVSPNEPYNNNRGVKYGGWFMDYELPLDLNIDKMKSSYFEVPENTVSEIGRGRFKLAVEISEEDAKVLYEVIHQGTWKEGTTECESDCSLNLKGDMIYYHSSCGTFNKYNLKEMSVYSSKVQKVNGKSLVVSDEDRIIINTILEKYVTLEIDSN